jgi:hypothetical protein
MAKVKKASNGCWHWTGGIDRYGYGHFSTGSHTDGSRRNVQAHRFAYGRVVEPLPEKRDEPGHKQVDHECHNRSQSCAGGPTCLHRRCVNPAHLRAVVARANILAGKTRAAASARQTHCVNGHEFTPENTGRTSRGHRRCKQCSNERTNEKRRAAAAARGPIQHYQQRKTHCPCGHPYSGDNLVHRSDGGRGCRACMKRRSDDHRARKLGRPLPGHWRDRTHCVNGHPLSGDNLYIAPGRGNRQCRTCKAEHDRRRRAEARRNG